MKKVGYPGIRGAFSDEAGLAYFDTVYAGVGLGSFEDVCQAVKEKSVDHGILPVENSSTGSIGQVFDLIEKYDLMITGEKKLLINHHLLGMPKAEIQDIQCIYSHPQAFKQCQKNLKNLSGVEHIVTPTTANGARVVSTKGCLTQAAIGSEYAAETYGLEVLESSIQDRAENATRFIILSDWAEIKEVSDKISLSFVLKHEPGALSNILLRLAEGGYNLTHIESRPIVGQNWCYRFFIDIEGNLQDLKTTFLMKELRRQTIDFRIIGQYKGDKYGDATKQ